MSSDQQTQPGRAMRRSEGLMWAIALAGIGLWMVHITAVSGLAKFACNEKGSLWWLHVATVVTAVPTILSMRVCWNLIRHSEDDESEGTLAGNHTFLGVFGIITGGFSLLLILFEGSYIFFLSPCA
jgi:hypothetical protein